MLPLGRQDLHSPPNSREVEALWDIRTHIKIKPTRDDMERYVSCLELAYRAEISASRTNLHPPDSNRPYNVICRSHRYQLKENLSSSYTKEPNPSTKESHSWNYLTFPGLPYTRVVVLKPVDRIICNILGAFRFDSRYNMGTTLTCFILLRISY